MHVRIETTAHRSHHNNTLQSRIMFSTHNVIYRYVRDGIAARIKGSRTFIIIINIFNFAVYTSSTAAVCRNAHLLPAGVTKHAKRTRRVHFRDDSATGCGARCCDMSVGNHHVLTGPYALIRNALSSDTRSQQHKHAL